MHLVFFPQKPIVKPTLGHGLMLKGYGPDPLDVFPIVGSPPLQLHSYRSGFETGCGMGS